MDDTTCVSAGPRRSDTESGNWEGGAEKVGETGPEWCPREQGGQEIMGRWVPRSTGQAHSGPAGVPSLLGRKGVGRLAKKRMAISGDRGAHPQDRRNPQGLSYRGLCA